MATWEKIAKEFVRAAFNSKREGDRLHNRLIMELRKLHSDTRRMALMSYTTLTNNLLVDGKLIRPSQDNLLLLSEHSIDFESILNFYRVSYRQTYEAFRMDLAEALRRKEKKLEDVLSKVNIDEDRATPSQGTVDLMNAINENMYRNIEAIVQKWKNYVYDTFFIAITQSQPKVLLSEAWLTDDKKLKIGSSLDAMAEIEASKAAIRERIAYVQEQAKVSGYTYCWNVNPMDMRTKPECISACLAGVIPEATMGTDYGFPPRYICRCDLAYTRKEWVELNQGINKEIEEVRQRLIVDLIEAPRQKSSWYRGETLIVPKDPERASGTKMYADIEEKLAVAEGMSVPDFREEKF
jgi:hypothetical protein